MRELTSDQVFTMAFGASLAVHLVSIAAQFLPWNWASSPRIRTPIEVVYDVEVAQQELQQLEQQLARAKRETIAAPVAIDIGQHTQIRIPDRPLLATTRNLSDIMPAHGSFIDLTNLTEASQGDPILLSYFSAVREQIQRAANRRGWLTLDDTNTQGLVYVSFVLTSTGAVKQTRIVSDRSVAFGSLRNVAVRIVEMAAPFPPFPPSISDPVKTIVVPLEFLLDSEPS